MIRLNRVFNTTVLKKRNLHSIISCSPVPNVNLNEYIWQNLNKWHDKTALVCTETNRSYTYLELYKKSNSLANFLYKFNRKKPSCTVAVALPNVPEYPIIVLGIIQAGLRATPVNPFFTPDEFGKQLLHSDSELIVTTNVSYKAILEALQRIKLDIPVMIVKLKKDESLPNGTFNFSDLSQGPHDLQFKVDGDQNDTIIMPFSSGTTGPPKGVELTNRNIISALHQMSQPKIDILEDATGSEQDILPAILPMYHIYGLILVLLYSLTKGSKIITIPKFTSQILINILERHTSLITYSIPPIVHMLINNSNITRSHLMNIKAIMCGGAPIGLQDIIKLCEKAGRSIDFRQGYGLTECTCLTHFQTPFLEKALKVGGVGILFPLLEGKIVSVDNGKDLDSSQSGEILLRGSQIMKGYYKNEKATQEAFTQDKWFKTGDVGYYDEDGHFFVTDRIKELIKVNGYSVSPVELEELIRQHPDVDDIAVIGVPHDKFGEVPKAFIVQKRGSKLCSTIIQEFVNNRVTNYKQLIGGVSFIDFIPKATSGKILRGELKNF